jgi:hypothetical protein
MSLQVSTTKGYQPKVHFSEYIRTENTPDEDNKPEKPTQPQQPKAE